MAIWSDEGQLEHILSLQLGTDQLRTDRQIANEAISLQNRLKTQNKENQQNMDWVKIEIILCCLILGFSFGALFAWLGKFSNSENP